MHTAEGRVEVEPAEIERVLGDAHVETISPDEESVGASLDLPDRPTPPSMRRRILLRDGARCANPRCQNRADHCHHVVFLADGGRTELANELATCATCHALIHAGLLSVTGDARKGFRWSSRDEALTGRIRAAAARAGRLPVFKLESASVEAASSRFSRTRQDAASTADLSHAQDAGESAYADSPDLDLDLLATGLVRLGCTKSASREAVRQAYEGLDPAQRTESEVLRKALAST